METKNSGLPPVVTDIVGSVRERAGFMRPDALRERLEALGPTKYANAGFTTLYDDFGQPVRPFIVESRHSAAEGAEEILFVKRRVHSDESACDDTSDGLVHWAVSSDFLLQIGARALITFGADDEGAYLNSGLSGQPLDLELYFGNALRNGAQPDWAYPLGYKGYRFQPDPHIHPGTLGSMKIIQAFNPTVMMPGHNASMAPGVFWYSSHDRAPLFDAYYALSRMVGVPISSKRELPYITEYRPGIFHAVTSKLMIDHGNHSGLGESSGGYLQEVAPETLYTFSEIPLFLSRNMDSRVTARMVAKTVGQVERVLDIGRSVLHASKDEPPTQFYNSLQVWVDIVSQTYGKRSLARRLVRERGGAAEIFRTTRMLSPALKVAESLGNNALRQKVVETIRKNVHEVRKGSRLRTIPVHRMVGMQAGTLALASLSQSGRL